MSLYLMIVFFGLFEEDDIDNNICILYKLFFVIMFFLCIIFGIVIVCLLF